MKIFLLSFVLISSLFANNYKQFAKEMGYELEYSVALERAKKEKKDIMFVMVANFCPWCNKFEKLVLSKEHIDKRIKEKYIPLIMNREERNFPKIYDAPIIPTIYFINHRKEVVEDKVIGYNNRQDFINIINQ